MLANFRELGLYLNSDWLAGLEVVHDGPLTEDDVYFALMYSDLRESCIFPTDSPLRPEILQNSTKLSHGSFLLQVTSSEDISIPDAQRPRTTGTSETRMLKLSLNFGNGPSVTAVELERIPQIPDCPDAGLKILILDEPMIVHGILFLKPGNVRIVGGDVTQLLDEQTRNNRARIMSRDPLAYRRLVAGNQSV